MSATRIEIDPNVRVRNNETFAGLEDVVGPLVLGDSVTVFESEGHVVGSAIVSDIDPERELVYLRVDWSSLRQDESYRGADWQPAHNPLEEEHAWSAVDPSAREPVVTLRMAGPTTLRDRAAAHNEWVRIVGRIGEWRLADQPAVDAEEDVKVAV